MKRLTFYLLLILFAGCASSGFVPPSNSLCEIKLERTGKLLKAQTKRTKELADKYKDLKKLHNAKAEEWAKEKFELDRRIAVLRILLSDCEGENEN